MNAFARAQKLAAELRSSPIDNQRDYDHYSKKVDRCLAELNSLWSNPADVLEAGKIKNELVAAWNGESR